MSAPNTRCPHDQQVCEGRRDCRGCPRFPALDVAWVCAFCSSPEERGMTVPGSYAAGACERCLCERALLVPVRLSSR